MFDGYLDDPEATADVLVDGWYDTGDLAETDDEGYLTIVGRARDVIRTGGETVAPPEVETVLGAIAAVADVAVVGLPDGEWGEVVCAVVVVAPGEPTPDLAALRAVCVGKLATYKHPAGWPSSTRFPARHRPARSSGGCWSSWSAELGCLGDEAATCPR